MTRRTRRLSRYAAVVGVGVGAIVLAACGDDGGSSDEAAYTDAIATQISENADADTMPLSDEQADCVASGFVNVIGVDGLNDLGLDLDSIEAGEELDESELSEDQARELTDEIFDCVDLTELMLAEIGSDVSEESAACLSDRLRESETFRDLIAAGLIGDDAALEDDTAAQGAIIDVMTECLSGEELAELGS